MPSSTWRRCRTIRSAISTRRSTYDINHRASVRVAKAAKQAGVDTLPAGLVVLQLRPRRRRHARRDRRPQSGDRLRAVEGLGRTRHRAVGRQALLADLHAARHGLWAFPAAALRHRAQQPRRLGHRPAGASTSSPTARRGGRSCISSDISAAFIAALAAPVALVLNEAFNVGQTVAQLSDPRYRRHRRGGRAGLPAGVCAGRWARLRAPTGSISIKSPGCFPHSSRSGTRGRAQRNSIGPIVPAISPR